MMKKISLLILFSAICVYTYVNAAAAFGIQSLTWVDPNTDTDVRLLRPVDTLYFETGFNVRANTYGEVGSVYFEITANYKRTENQVPFALAGDINGDYEPYYSTIYPGKHYTLIATPYSGKNRTGQKGVSIVVDLIWLNSMQPARIDSLVLVDAVLDQNLRRLKDNDTLYAGEALNIVAHASGAVNSVRFQLNTNFNRTESYPPYALTGSTYDNYANWFPTPGSYTLTVTPYAGRGGTGGAGPPYIIHFVVLDEDKTNNPCRDLLRLAFENSLNGAGGESPLTGTGVTFVTGKNGQGGYFSQSSNLKFVAEENINPKRGSLEFWVNPDGQWLDNESYTFLAIEGAVTTMGYGDYLFGKDANNNIVGIFNRFTAGNEPMLMVSYNIDQLDQDTWHYIVYTWGNGSMQLYLDGEFVDEEFTSGNPFPGAWGNFRIGYDEHIADGDPLNAILDDLVTTNCIKTAEEIRATYQEQGFARLKSAADFHTNDLKLYPNPAEHRLTIQTQGVQEGALLEIQNNIGISMKSEIVMAGADEMSIDLADLPAGIYFIKISGNDKIFCSKFIKK